MEARHSRNDREKRGLTPGQEPTFAGVPLAHARVPAASVDSPNSPFGIAPLGAGTPLSNGGGTSQHSAASDLHTTQDPERPKIFSVDDPEDPSTPVTYRASQSFFASRGGVPAGHKDDLSVPSRTSAEMGFGQRANSSASRVPRVAELKRAGSHEPSTDRRASETVEMKELAHK